jgi:acyl-CoA synthetase (AMP-forming)/AMP-acid ligase II
MAGLAGRAFRIAAERRNHSMARAGHFFLQLAAQAQNAPTARALTFLEHGESETSVWHWAELWTRIAELATHLVRSGLRAQPVLLVHPPGPDFVAAFCACLRSGAIAVPAPEPTTARNITRIQSIAQATQPLAVLGTAAQLTDGPTRTGLTGVRWIASDDATGEAADNDLPSPAGDATAFLQFTSGSTQAPRGVVISHDNLEHNLAMIRSAFAMAEHSGDSVLSWTPHYHDMGLVSGLLAPLAWGVPAVFMPPMAFLQRPERWLRAISRYGATLSGGPDFAYALCAARITPERLAGLDLSSWRLAYSGAERVRPATLRRFARGFGPAGFRPGSFFPCYGLAEATLFVSGAHLAADLPWLTAEDTAVPDNVDCGVIQAGQRLAIVDPHTRQAVQDGENGEIWVAGPHVTNEYWNNEAATTETCNVAIAAGSCVGFVRTGDVGVLRAGRLTVQGRIKHVIVVRGAKHQAEDRGGSVSRYSVSVPLGGSPAG